MKWVNNLKFFLPLFILAFAFMSCDTDDYSVGTLEDAVERIPDVQLIQGADNATVNVKNDRDRSYFKISIDNTSGLNGVYNAWCVQLDVSLQRGVEHPGTRLYSTDGDKVFNKLSYVVNTRNRYEREFDGLSWREIQVAMWVILETKDYNLAAIESRIPSSVEGYNSTYVNEILNDVQTNGSNFEPGPFDTRLIYYELQNNQNGVGEQTAWAWAGFIDEDTGEPVSEYSRTFRELDKSGQWGWFIYYEENTWTEIDPLEAMLWAGAGQNEDSFDDAYHVGWVYLYDDGENLFIRYEMKDDFYMTEVHGFVGDNYPNQIAPGNWQGAEDGAHYASFGDDNLAEVTEHNETISLAGFAWDFDDDYDEDYKDFSDHLIIALHAVINDE